jgi:hypothetical protein
MIRAEGNTWCIKELVMSDPELQTFDRCKLSICYRRSMERAFCGE